MDLGSRIIKVNHAGEHGAIQIYTGQIMIAHLTAPALVEELSEFRSHELRHLEHQLAQLRHSDPDAVAAITAIIEDEQQHHDRSAALARAGSFWPRLLTPVVTASTAAVIWVGMRA